MSVEPRRSGDGCGSPAARLGEAGRIRSAIGRSKQPAAADVAPSP